MQLRLFLIFVLGHLIGDFVLQNQNLCNQRFPNKQECGKKRAIKSILKGNLKHCAVHLIVLILLMLLFLRSCYGDNSASKELSYVQVILFSLCFLVSHFIIDVIKSWMTYQNKAYESNLFFFLGDQLLHISVLLLLFIPWIPNWTMMLDTNDFLEQINQTDRILFAAILIVFSTFFAGIFIKIFMDYLDVRNSKPVKKEAIKRYRQKTGKAVELAEVETAVAQEEVDGEIRQGGYIIGILERFFILCSLIMSMPQLIGFMLTVKSIVRLKKMSKDKFAEYFLIGNLLSFLFAIVPGFLLCNII